MTAEMRDRRKRPAKRPRREQRPMSSPSKPRLAFTRRENWIGRPGCPFVHSVFWTVSELPHVDIRSRILRSTRCQKFRVIHVKSATGKLSILKVMQIATPALARASGDVTDLSVALCFSIFASRVGSESQQRSWIFSDAGDRYTSSPKLHDSRTHCKDFSCNGDPLLKSHQRKNGCMPPQWQRRRVFLQAPLLFCRSNSSMTRIGQTSPT
jgi:hypothetical protein